MRKLFAVFSVLTLAITPCFAEGLGGGVGFQRSALVIDGHTVSNLGNPSPGVHYVVGMDESAPGAGDATWGFEFGTNFVSDNDLLVSNLQALMWTNWKQIRIAAGAQQTFVDPGDAGGKLVLAETTNLLGPCGSIQFLTVDNYTAEMGGSWTWRWDGVEGVNTREIHLGLVGSF